MSELPTFLLITALVLKVVHVVLPRAPRLQYRRGSLVLSPPLPRLLGESTIALLALSTTAYLVAVLLARGAAPAALIGAFVLAWLAWVLWRRWHAGRVVFDRRADRIHHGPALVGRASQAAIVQITGGNAPALIVLLHAMPGPDVLWPVPGVDIAHAPVVGRALADYLDVPLLTRMAPPGATRGG
jgi:hypothetical protein